MKQVEQIEKDLRNLQEVISSFQDGLDEIKYQLKKLQEKEERTYSTGDRFKFTGVTVGEYILSRCDSNVVLTNLGNGNQFAEPVEVNDPYEITLEEFRRITANRPDRFHLIKSSDLKQHNN